MKKLLQSTITIAALAAIPSISSAVTLIQENFDGYNSSAVALNGQSGGTGFSGNWTAGSGGSTGYNNTKLTYSVTGYTNTGLTGALDGAASNNNYGAGVGTVYSYRSTGINAATTFATAGTTAWFSFLTNSSDVSATNNVFMGFMNVNNALFGQDSFTIGTQDSRFYNSYNFNGNPGGLNTQYTAVDTVVAGTTNLIVGRYTSGGTGVGDTIDIWFNPADLASVGASSTGAGQFSRAINDLKGSGNFAFGSGIQIGIRSDAGTPNNNFADSFRFAYGDTSADQFASVMTGVPEPSTYAALLGGIGILALRRRRA